MPSPHETTEFARLIGAIPTQALMQACNVKGNTVGRWQRGELLPRKEQLVPISEATGIPLERLREAYANDRMARLHRKRSERGVQ